MKKLFFVLCSVVILTSAFVTSTHALEGDNRIVVAFDPYLAPLQYDDGGQYRGFSIELFNYIAQLEGLTFEYRPLTLENSIDELIRGDVDVILGVHFLDNHAQVMELSNSFLSSSNGLLVRKENQTIEGITDLSNKVTSLQRGTVEYEFMRNIRRIKYNVTSNQLDGFKLLENGRSEAFIGDTLVAEYYIGQAGGDYKFVANNLLPIEYTFAVQKGNYQLVNQINRGLRKLKSEGHYTELYQKWFVSSNEETTKRLLLIIKIFGGLLGVTLLLFLVGLRWNRQLKHMIDKKTKDLSELNRELERQNEQTKNNYIFQKQILNSSPRGIVTCDKDRTITSINPKALEIAGVSGNVIGSNYEIISLVKDLLADRIDTVFHRGENFLGEETSWNRGDREYFIRYYIYPQYDFERKITGLILTFEDGTEDRKLKQQIFEQEKNQALSRVVAGIAHEIRNPLTSIKTFVELIPKKIHNKRFQDDISTYLPVEIKRINQLIEGLIDYARPRSFNKEMVDVGHVVRECVILFERTVENKGFTLVSSVIEGLIIEADRNQLKQIVINLIINSIDAMTSQTTESLTLEVNAYAKEEEVYIEVIDEGVGIAKAEFDRIFEPFYTTKAKGTGLGLAIAQQYVQENSGTLEIQSEVGTGTKMIVRFLKKGDIYGEDIDHR